MSRTVFGPNGTPVETWDATGYTRRDPTTAVIVEQRSLTAAEADAEAASAANATSLVNRVTVNTRALAAIDALTTITQSSGTLTTAQLSTGLRVVAKAVVALLRLYLNRTDDDAGTT